MKILPLIASLILANFMTTVVHASPKVVVTVPSLHSLVSALMQGAAEPVLLLESNNVFPEKPYGAFRVEAWVENPDGQRISPYNEIVVYRLHRPRHWMEDSPNSSFGVHTNSTTRHILKHRP